MDSKQNQIRPIHYLGSKLRLLDFIQSAIDDIDPNGGVCDLFAGTGSVAYRLSQNHKVTAVDIQEYSRVICSALLNNQKLNADDVNRILTECQSSDHRKLLAHMAEPMVEYEKVCVIKSDNGNPEPLCELLEKGSIITFEILPDQHYSADLLKALKETNRRMQASQLMSDNSALTLRYFGGLYFSYAQAVDIDSLLYRAFCENTESRDILLASMLSTASDLVNTVGKQFAQPIKPRNSDGTPKNNLARILAKDRALDAFKVFEEWLVRYVTLKRYDNKNVVLRKDYSEALDLLDSDTKIIYADPPYTRDHYSRFYHVLETLCLRDNPTISMSTIGGLRKLSRGVYREDRHQSPFCIKSKAPEAFDVLFSKSRNLNATLLLSYSPYDEKSAHPRLLTIKDLRNIAKKYYGHIEVVSAGNFSHSKLNSSDKHLESSKKAELLLICTV